MSRSKIPSRKFNKSEFFKNLQRSDLQGHIYRSEVKNKQKKHKPSNMCVCHSTQQKTCSGLHQFPVVEDSFIDQDEQNLSLIVLATDISKDIRRTEQTYNLRQEGKGACALVQSRKYLEASAVPRNVQGIFWLKELRAQTTRHSRLMHPDTQATFPIHTNRKCAKLFLP